ncbi:hypothetical protein GYMLUDRAFT_672890 [Collybiopsis luxurians FD-317 M1]|uniref:Uncharacterized protein n=1 Tax=Collybiopsis luxurians FD-317 M1 TaxID=944289 RepID=A0A0D0B7W8_9AGAR|nr:hypothetical protein GYMLUDRAFT_672890 [Collybiopsis luxurians FD-317 M1]
MSAVLKSTCIRVQNGDIRSQSSAELQLEFERCFFLRDRLLSLTIPPRYEFFYFPDPEPALRPEHTCNLCNYAETKEKKNLKFEVGKSMLGWNPKKSVRCKTGSSSQNAVCQLKTEKIEGVRIKSEFFSEPLDQIEGLERNIDSLRFGNN